MKVYAAFEWKLADLLVGAFWKWEYLRSRGIGGPWRLDATILHVWICLLPCVPLHVEFWKNESEAGA